LGIHKVSDPYKLSRFIKAQDRVYSDVIEELRRGRKTGHWIWYVFPQIKGLGRSGRSRYYSISSIAEAAAYMAHPVLGRRLLKCTKLVLEVEGKTAEQIFGVLDAMKFRSSMTLFSAVKNGNEVFQCAIDKYFDGVANDKTVRLLSSPVD